jgi:hypothetical protein
MIQYYQPFLLPFLGSKKSKLSDGLKRYYYHSFEDALWDLFINKHIPKGAVILIPDFYCMDVVGNIQTHGYIPVFYPVDAHFQIAPRKLNAYIESHHPSVVILFHACGIANRTLTPSWITTHKNTLIVEDCVHRLVNPAGVNIMSDNHFVIDSLRKVSPLPGSFLYGTQKGLLFSQSNARCAYYILSSFFWYVLFRTVLCISAILNWPHGSIWAHETLLKRHDDIIGDNSVPAAGLPQIGSLTQWFAYKKISKHKTNQVALYRTLTATLPRLFYPIHIPEDDFGGLHVYPVGMERIPPDFIKQLHRLGIVIWCKFEDAPWSKRTHVLFLPLGFHISDKEIRDTIRAIVQLTSPTPFAAP